MKAWAKVTGEGFEPKTMQKLEIWLVLGAISKEGIQNKKKGDTTNTLAMLSGEAVRSAREHDSHINVTC